MISYENSESILSNFKLKIEGLYLHYYNRTPIMQPFHVYATPSDIYNNSNILRRLYHPLPEFVLNNGRLTISNGTIEIQLTLQDNTLCFQLTNENVEVGLMWNDDMSFWEQTTHLEEHFPAEVFLNSFWGNVRYALR